VTSSMQAVILNMANKNRAIFFDRDGTLNVEVDYLYRPEDFRWMPEAVEALRYCHEQGYLAVVITNQSGVARGFYHEEDVVRLHRWMNRQLAEMGEQPIDGFYYCPHHPQGTVPQYTTVCSCRKPQPGMIVQACRELQIDPAQSWMIGDSLRDVESGEAAGVRGVRYTGGSLLECLKENLGKR